MLYNYTKSKLSLNSNGDFPLIPIIYTEYAGDLLKNNNTDSSMLYLNYALSYLNLNIYLKEHKNVQPFFNEYLNRVFHNELFLIALIFLIAFIDF